MQLTKFYKMNMVELTNSRTHELTNSRTHELTNSLGDNYSFKNILKGRMPDFMDGILPFCV